MQYPEAWVRAAPMRGGLAGKRRVPLESSRKRFITEQLPVRVALSAYYLRALARGDLVRVSDDELTGPPEKYPG